MTACAIADCEKTSHAQGYCKGHYWRWLKHGDPLAGATKRGAGLQWLRDHIDFAGDECLIWPFGRFSSGAGNVWFRGRSSQASRVMCELAHGAPPTPNYEAAHSCGRGGDACCNRNHLRWATGVENSADKLVHGTVLRGELSPTAKLKSDDVKQIRALRASGVSRIELGKLFSVTPRNVSAIVQRRTWAWLD